MCSVLNTFICTSMSTSMSVTKSYTNRLKSDVKCMLENFEGKIIFLKILQVEISVFFYT